MRSAFTPGFNQPVLVPRNKKTAASIKEAALRAGKRRWCLKTSALKSGQKKMMFEDISIKRAQKKMMFEDISIKRAQKKKNMPLCGDKLSMPQSWNGIKSRAITFTIK